MRNDSGILTGKDRVEDIIDSDIGLILEVFNEAHLEDRESDGLPSASKLEILPIRWYQTNVRIIWRHAQSQDLSSSPSSTTTTIKG